MPPYLRSGVCQKPQQRNIELTFYKQAADELGAKTTGRGCRRTLGVGKCLAGRSGGYGGAWGLRATLKPGPSKR